MALRAALALFTLLWVELLWIVVHPAGGEDGCSFKSKECTYHVQLNQADSECSDSAIQREASLSGHQNDVTEKMSSMEKNLLTVKDNHERRLGELENVVRELLGLDKVRLEGSSLEGEEVRRERVEMELMKKLHDEFSRLRDEIRQKSVELHHMAMKLNETERLFEDSELNLFTVKEQLLNAHNKIAIMESENDLLQKQLNEKTQRAELLQSLLEECQNVSLTKEAENSQLTIEGSVLREELAVCSANLNRTTATLKQLQVKSNAIEKKNNETRNILRIREREITACYKAKTQTFCGFENIQVCGFTQINDTDDFDWTWVQGKTPSPNTGPTGDHTCESAKGHFMYLEASARGKGQRALMFSPLYRSTKLQCVEFFYHMWGKHIGILNVYAKARGADLMSVWRASGNQGDFWSYARLQIPTELARAGFQIAFEGITANGYQGDMAIDDITVADGECPVDEKVLPVQIRINATTLEGVSTNVGRKIKGRHRQRSGKKGQGGEEEAARELAEE